MTRTTDSRKRIRALLDGQRCVTMATVFDPISARFAERIGFEAGLLGGSLASYVVLGAPDVVLITLGELAEQVHRCTRAAAVPLVVDADHGYGNALNVMRTVVELDAVGAAAVTIEDTLLPRAYGPGGSAELVAFDEAVGKMKAAVRARGDSDLLVLGRTSAASIAGIDEAVARFKAFESAGVDALFLPLLRTREELDRIAAAVRLPLLVGGPAAALADPDYLASRGARLWSNGHQTFGVALQALYDAMRAVHDGTSSASLPGIAPQSTLDLALAADDYRRWAGEFLGAR